MYIYHKIIFFYLITFFLNNCHGVKFNLLKHQENKNTKRHLLTLIPLEDFKSIVLTSNISAITKENELKMKPENYSDPTDFMLQTIFQIKWKKYKYYTNLNILNLYDKNRRKRLEINFYRNKHDINLVINLIDPGLKNQTGPFSESFVIPKNKWNKLTISFKENTTVNCWINCALNIKNNSITYSAFPISWVSGKLFTDGFLKKNFIKIESFELHSNNTLNSTLVNNCTDIKNMDSKRYRRQLEDELSTLLFDPIKLFDLNSIEPYDRLEDEFAKLLSKTTEKMRNDSLPVVLYEWNFSRVF